jgi:hypothetical protein
MKYPIRDKIVHIAVEVLMAIGALLFLRDGILWVYEKLK